MNSPNIRMVKTDKRVDAYILKAAAFAQPILNHLRLLVHTGCPGIEETIKWGCPHFDYHGVLCSMAAFKEHCAFGFKKAALMSDQHKGFSEDTSTAGDFGRIRTLADLPSDEIIIEYVHEAAELNKKGIKLPAKVASKSKTKLTVPSYFIERLKKNKKAYEAFEAFSPSHKREYIDWITEAKSEDTRAKRMTTAVEWMANGKSRHWKYQQKK